jgi:hypothetical protein
MLRLILHSSPGNMLQLLLPQQYGDQEFGWLNQFGSVYSIRGCFGVSSLSFIDFA